MANGYDMKEEYYKTTLEFKSSDEMAETFVADYKEMLESIQKYGGFYIGRYELSAEGVQKDKATLTKTNWYALYKICKELKASEKVKTQMIWGCQWDMACNFIATKGEQKSTINSSSWGNYRNSTEPANEGNYEQFVKKNTGSNEAWQANNIYDMAGNCTEWTQEAIGWSRVARGGNYANGGDSESPVFSRSNSWFASPDWGTSPYVRYSSNSNSKIVVLTLKNRYDILAISKG